MKLMVMERHEGYGSYPLFKKETVVHNCKVCQEYPHWYSCTIEGQETFVPDIYVDGGVLTKDYNPTELITEKGRFVTLIALVYEWAYVKDENGINGWLPASKLVSAQDTMSLSLNNSKSLAFRLS